MITIPAVMERCAGIDVGKRELAVALIVGPADKDGEVTTRAFGTTMPELEKLKQWLITVAHPGKLHQRSNGKHGIVLDSGEEHSGGYCRFATLSPVSVVRVLLTISASADSQSATGYQPAPPESSPPCPLLPLNQVPPN